MRLQFFCPRWGSEKIDWNIFMAVVKHAGFDGIEWAITKETTPDQINLIWRLAEKNRLHLIAQHYDTFEADFKKHSDQYAQWLKKIKAYPWLKINSQTGKDYFSFDENKELIEMAGEGVVHETHRGKFSFAAHVTKSYLEKIPGLHITLDVSHWVNVSESFLEDQEEAMQLAIERTRHIHARVGYTQGPQVPDPRVPQWKEALDKHLGWWDRVIKSVISTTEEMTITPECGPYPYMILLPRTQLPIASQWEINEWLMNLLKEKYGKE